MSAAGYVIVDEQTGSIHIVCEEAMLALSEHMNQAELNGHLEVKQIIVVVGERERRPDNGTP